MLLGKDPIKIVTIPSGQHHRYGQCSVTPSEGFDRIIGCGAAPNNVAPWCAGKVNMKQALAIDPQPVKGVT